MQLRDYTDLPLTPGFPDFAVRLKQFSETTAKESVFGRNAASITQSELLAFNKLFQMQSHAYRDAPAAPGRFPVVVYHPGAAGSFDENTILCEFLASHGYVVLSSAYQTSTLHVSNDVDLTSRSIRDMQFLMQAASKLPNVDVTKVAGVGHSAGAQTLMQWIGEVDCPLTAMVSLDTTVEYTPRDYAGHKELRQALENMEKPTIPVMLFASAERRPDFTRFDKFLQRAPRYEVAVPYLRHSEYISQGAMRAALPYEDVAERKSSTASMRDSYDQVCVTIRRFLDFVLKSDEKAEAVLDQSTALHSSPLPFKLRYKAPR
jgi:Chlorophyllase enzyme